MVRLVMGRWIKIVVAVLVLVSLPVVAQTNSVEEFKPKILITEVLTKPSSGQNKFIELYNLTNEPIDLEDWKIQRTLATGTEWQATSLVSLKVTIQPRGFFLITKSGTGITSDIEHSLTNLTQNEGHIRLLAPDGNVHDTFGWTDHTKDPAATVAEGVPFSKTDINSQIIPFVAGESLKRKVNEDGRFIDTDHNLNDFFTSTTPTPSSSLPPKSEEAVLGSNTSRLATGFSSTSSSSETNETGSGPYAKLELSELFPDPDKPLTDAEDEFVEIYNPNPEPVDLEDFVIQTGMSYSYKFTLPRLSLKSGQYLALFAVDTNLTLSNSEGQARLLDPAGKVVFETPAYSSAEPSTSWANINGKWQWTAKPTPNAANVAGSAASGAELGLTNLEGGQVLGAISNDGRNIYEDPEAVENQVDTAVVAGIGGLALLYAGYEYRLDLANRINQLKRYLATRRGGGTSG